jgi:hypothetical protein
LDQVRTEHGQNPLWQDFNQFRFGSGQIPGLDQKFLVQIGFWTESKPDLLEIVSGKIWVGLGFTSV